MELQALDSEVGQRLDRWLADRMAITRNRAQALIKGGAVVSYFGTLMPDTKIKRGFVVTVSQLSERSSTVLPEDIPLDILFEDDCLIAVNKEAGLVVHPAAGHWTGTLANALLYHCRGIGSVGAGDRPGIVHRLDRYTSGVMIAVKRADVMEAVVEQFRSGKLVKQYIAIVRGRPPRQSGRIESLIGRDSGDRKKMSASPKSGKAALTEYRVLAETPGFSLLLVRIHTGRTHQIRVHMAHMGMPVAGDPQYGGRHRGLIKRTDAAKPGRQMLHSWRLQMKHPVGGRNQLFEAPLPSDIRVFAESISLPLDNLPPPESGLSFA